LPPSLHVNPEIHILTETQCAEEQASARGPARPPLEPAAIEALIAQHPRGGVRNLFIAWPAQSQFPVEVFYAGSRGRIVLMMGFAANIRLLHLLSADDYVFSMRSYDDREPEFETHRYTMELFGLSRNRVIFLCASEAQAQIARASGLRAEVFNPNAMLDERIFHILPRTKIYDAVSNARLVKYKRVSLARRVGRLAIIGGHRIEGGEYDDPALIPHAYLAPRELSENQVVEVLSRSQVGLALSAREGACFASSEYLLCGLPVVSTPSLGGRDVWYDSDNSIICEPNEAAVAAAVLELVGRLARGDIRREAIRQRHIQQAAAQRSRLVALLDEALAALGVGCDAEARFRALFHNKFACNVWSSYADLCRRLKGSDDAGTASCSPDGPELS
jgi:hypothetical protein